MLVVMMGTIAYIKKIFEKSKKLLKLDEIGIICT